MRAEIIIFIVAAVIIANIYTDGKILKQLFSYKKYYQMAGIAFGAFVLYYLIRKNPDQTRNIISTTGEYIKYLPVDRNTSSMISPILDFTSKSYYSGDAVGGGGYNFPIMAMPNANEDRILNSGRKGTKRSVSETKKKFVAARQNWRCENCDKQLPAWFEVDHKVRLEYGGSNHVDNLRALCRDCHGEKTAIENL
jgi:5-methylcytosine-specific restriction endonuclease McrA